MPLAAYFDESGTNPNDPALVIAGFVADVERWAEFSAKWQAKMDEWGLIAWHMADYEARRGEFVRWPRDDRSKLRLDYLLSLINEHTLALVSTALPHVVFDAYYIAAPKKMERMYQAAVGATLASTYLLPLDLYRGDDMALIFEQGARGRHQVQEAYDRFRRRDFGDEVPRLHFRSLTFGTKTGAQPLQAADILAYEEFRNYPKFYRGDRVPVRYPLKRLIDRARIRNRGVMDVNYLQWAQSIVADD